MLRFLVGLAVVACLAACLALPFIGCSSEKSDNAAERSSQSQSTAKSTSNEPRSKIPPKEDAPAKVAGVLIKPYFDDSGSVTEMAVEAGQTFDFYVFAEYPDPYHIAAAEFRLDLPAGRR
jgi:hypothetical protein